LLELLNRHYKIEHARERLKAAEEQSGNEIEQSPEEIEQVALLRQQVKELEQSPGLDPLTLIALDCNGGCVDTVILDLQRFIAAAESTEAQLKTKESRGAPAHIAKRLLFCSLKKVFMQYRGDPGEDSPERDLFVQYLQVILQAANIEYSDPDRHPDDFDALLFPITE